MPLRVGICGVGTVGQGVLYLLTKKAGSLDQKQDCSPVVTCLGMRTPRPQVDTTGLIVFADVLQVAESPAVDVLIETMGGVDDAKTLITTALARGKHVITANKALIATHGQALCQQAQQAGRSLKFEAAVGGAVPIIKVLTETLANDKVTSIRGIMNGTANYILSAMARHGTSFASALATAQELKYAEADPAFDIDGTDSAHKLCILAALAFGTAPAFDQVTTEGIRKISPTDILLAKKLGGCIKHLASAQRHSNGYTLQVQPRLLPKEHLLAGVNDAMNGFEVVSEIAGNTFYYGAGAGALPTALSILADLTSILNLSGNKAAGGTAFGDSRPQRSTPNTASDGHYIRLTAQSTRQATDRLQHILDTHSIQPKAHATASSDNATAVITENTEEQTLQKALAEVARTLPTAELRHIRFG